MNATQPAEHWFQEDLVPEENRDDSGLKKGPKSEFEADAETKAEVRADKPRWKLLPHGEVSAPMAAARTKLILVQFGFQFSVPLKLYEKGVRIVWARCSALIESKEQVSVIDVFPRDLYGGTAKQVHVNLSPRLKLGFIEASVGEVSGDLSVGKVEPIIVGYPGRDGREPYWEISPKEQDFLGVRNFWSLLELADECKSISIYVKAEAEVQRRFLGKLPLSPRRKSWDERPKYEIVL